MTTKDYKVLADIFATALNEESSLTGRRALWNAADCASAKLEADNPRFNRTTFVQAIRDQQFDLATGQGRR